MLKSITLLKLREIVRKVNIFYKNELNDDIY